MGTVADVQGDRQGDHLGAGEVVTAQFVDALADGGRSGLLDPQIRVGLLYGGGPREQRVDVLLPVQLGAVHGDVDANGGAVRRVHGVGHRADLVKPAHPVGHVLRGGVGGGQVQAAEPGPRGDQHAFDGALLQPALGGRRFRPARLTDTEVLRERAMRTGRFFMPFMLVGGGACRQPRQVELRVHQVVDPAGRGPSTGSPYRGTARLMASR
ncbi:hypothetical protein [Streptomyces mirabilis]